MSMHSGPIVLPVPCQWQGCPMALVRDTALVPPPLFMMFCQSNCRDVKQCKSAVWFANQWKTSSKWRYLMEESTVICHVSQRPVVRRDSHTRTCLRSAEVQHKLALKTNNLFYIGNCIKFFVLRYSVMVYMFSKLHVILKTRCISFSLLSTSKGSRTSIVILWDEGVFIFLLCKNCVKAKSNM